jgi:hypothetical protein
MAKMFEVSSSACFCFEHVSYTASCLRPHRFAMRKLLGGAPASVPVVYVRTGLLESTITQVFIDGSVVKDVVCPGCRNLRESVVNEFQFSDPSEISAQENDSDAEYRGLTINNKTESQKLNHTVDFSLHRTVNRGIEL